MFVLLLFFNFGCEVIDEPKCNNSQIGLTRKSETTLVTAFFELNFNYVSEVDRSIGAYVGYFKRWARLKNDLVVFCQKELIKNEILSVRKEFGLENRTKVVIIDDIRSLEREIYDRMLEISNDVYFLRHVNGTRPRYLSANYVYLQNMKTYFLNRANREFNIKTENIAWVDFGFAHPLGDFDKFPYDDDFSFTLECEVSNKVSLSRDRHYIDPKKPLFEVLRISTTDAVDGSFFVCPTNLSKIMREIYRDYIFFFLDLGLMFDEQGMLYYSSQRRKDIFEVRLVDGWAEGPYEFCNANMRMAEEKK